MVFVAIASADITNSVSESASRQVSLQISGNRRVLATVKIPDHLKNGGKVPAFLIFGGFESAANVLELIHPNRRVALASFDYPFSASRKLDLKDGLEILQEARTLHPETVQGIQELVSVLKKMPEIDAHQIIVIGASFGSPFALAAAARDSDISGIVIVDGFGQVADTAEHVIQRSWLPKYGWIARPFSWLISRVGWLYLGVEAPEVDARTLRGGQRLLMITAKDDSFIPRSSSDSLWSAIQESHADSTRLVMPGDHLMPGADRLINQMIHEVEKWAVQKTRLHCAESLPFATKTHDSEQQGSN